MISKKLLIGSLAGMVLLLVVAGATVTAYAQSDSDDGPRWPGLWGHRGPHAGALGEFVDQDALHAELAEALGMTPDEFAEAREDGITLFELAEQNDVELEELREIQKQYVQQAIEEAIESGAMDEWLQEMPGPGFGRFGIGRGDGLLADYLDREGLDAALAEALGISAEELEEAREDGVTLFELAEEHDIELGELREIQADYHEQAIEAAVEDGAIEPELAERLEQMPEAGFGHLGHIGRPQGGGFGPRSGAGPGGYMRR